MTSCISDIFHIRYGHSLELNGLVQTDSDAGVAFVSRKSGDNGIAAYVEPLEGLEPAKPGEVSCALSGKVKSANLKPFVGVDAAVSPAAPPPPAIETWADFRYDQIFDIRKGYYNRKPPLSAAHVEDVLPFIGATDSSNGITSYHRWEDIAAFARNGEVDPDKSTGKKVFTPRCITVSNNGSVGYAFYQPVEFTCSHDVNPLYLLERDMTPEIGMFLCTIIGMDRYRWGYGRKWRPLRMPHSIISLPVAPDGKPDWEYMESYIRALPYSKTILEAA